MIKSFIRRHQAKRKILLISLCIIVPVIISASLYLTVRFVYHTEKAYSSTTSGIEIEQVFFCQWEIHNNSNEKIVIWLEKDSIVQNMAIGERIKQYFLSKKGDFSLLNLMNEYGSTLIGFESILFNTFYKIVEPHQTFLIRVINNQPNNNIDNDKIKKMIMTATPSQNPKNQFNIFDHAAFEMLSFKDDILIINEMEL